MSGTLYFEFFVENSEIRGMWKREITRIYIALQPWQDVRFLSLFPKVELRWDSLVVWRENTGWSRPDLPRNHPVECQTLDECWRFDKNISKSARTWPPSWEEAKVRSCVATGRAPGETKMSCSVDCLDNKQLGWNLYWYSFLWWFFWTRTLRHVRCVFVGVVW